MKYIKYFLLFLFIPFIALAEECDINNIVISSIEPISINGNLIEKTEASVEGQKINLDLKVYEEGDSIEYRVVLNNTSNEDYYFDENSLKQNNEYMSYEFIYDDNSNIIKPKEEKELIIRVTYKNKVQEESNNGSINKTNNITLNLSNKNTLIDPAYRMIENPNTNDKILLITVILGVTLVTIAIMKCIKKRKFVKSLLIFLPLLMIIPITVHAICKCNIELESKIEIKNVSPIFDAIEKASNEENSCISKYEGKITDELNKTIDATNVYFNKCSEKRNIIFGGFCWQMIRTNNTKGIRMIYNGEPTDGKCLSNRENHKGIINTSENNIIELKNSYLYGTSFTYDLNSATFKLKDTEELLWNNDTYADILGKYTCLSNNDTCSKIYFIDDYNSSSKAYYSSYIIDDTNYAQIGTSSYNSNNASLNGIAYMFNKTTDYNHKSMSTTNYLYGSSYSYDRDTDTYTITGETQTIGDWDNGYDKLNNTHYTCWNTNGTCKTISFVFRTSLSFFAYADYKGAEYINLSKGKTVEEVLDELYFNEDINKYDSTVKSYLENWYANNLLAYHNSIEDTVYCNEVVVEETEGFKENGILNDNIAIKFKRATDDLSCSNSLYQFNTINNKAKLKYPINLMKEEEYYKISKDNKELFATGNGYWISPAYFYIGNTGRSISYATVWHFPSPYYIGGIRPVISLKPNVSLLKGTGSETDPWIIK